MRDYKFQILFDVKILSKLKKVLLIILVLVFQESNAQSTTDSTLFYFNEKKYDKAINYLQKKIKTRSLINNKKKFIESLNDLAFLYNLNGNYGEAELNYKKMLFQLKKTVGTNNSDYAMTLNNLALTYIKNEKTYKKAEPLYINAIKIFKSNKKSHSPEVAALANNLGDFYKHEGLFKNAEKYFLQSLSINKKVLGENNRDFTILLLNLGDFFSENGSIYKAEEFYLKALEIRKKLFGEDHLDYAETLNSLANFYREIGNYEQSETYFIQTLQIRKNKLGESSVEVAQSLNDIGRLYISQGSYLMAESNLLKSAEIYKNIYGENNIYYSTLLINLSDLYLNLGDYQKVESLIIKSLEINKEIKGENSPDYAISLDYLGEYYDELGATQKAESVYLKSLDIRKSYFGIEHPDYGTSLQNLAAFYVNQKQYEKAEPLYLKSLEIYKKKIGVNHPDYALTLDNLGLLYIFQKKFQNAEPILLKSSELRKRLLGELNPVYAGSLISLGLLYFKQGDFKKAEPYYLQSLKIYTKLFGNKINPDFDNLIKNLALLYQNLSHPNHLDEALYFEKSLEYFQNQVKTASYFSTEKELENLRKKKFKDRFIPLSFINRFPSNFKNLNVLCFENEILLKNLSLKNQQLLNNRFKKNDAKADLIKLYEKFIFNKKQIARWNELPKIKWPSNYLKIYSETEQIEKRLTIESQNFSKNNKSNELTWENIKNELGPNEAIVDLISFNYHNKNWTDSIVYSAFILKSNSTYPVIIPLFEQKQFEELLDKNDSNSKDKTNRIYSNTLLGNLFFKPITKELESIKTIYLSLSGLSHQINFSALPIDDFQSLGEKYKIHLLNSPSELINHSSINLGNNDSEIILYGGIDYNKIDNNLITSETTNSKINLNLEDSLTNKTRNHLSNFNYINGTNNEINLIELHGKAKGFKTKVYKEAHATKTSIESLSGKRNPFILHLATHGFYFNNQYKTENEKNILNSTSEIYRTSENPMLRSGLVFAGANKFWNKTEIVEKKDNGILTANEITNLDLSNCNLVVLSACETGLGEILENEGVFGLQRAFKIAGVKNIIMSLWQIPDEQTTELFNLFYNECFLGKNIHDAFNISQSKMKSKYAPYYWAGFVLLE